MILIARSENPVLAARHNCLQNPSPYKQSFKADILGLEEFHVEILVGRSNVIICLLYSRIIYESKFTY